MNNNFLIPANSKRSMLIFGVFNKFDLILFGCGLVVTLIMMLIIPLDRILFVIITLAPAMVTGFLVMPVPNYHNVRTIIVSVYRFYTERHKFIWKGWCFQDGENEKK